MEKCEWAVINLRSMKPLYPRFNYARSFSLSFEKLGYHSFDG